MWDYTEKAKDHFLNPRNVGEIENPDGLGDVGSLACGDALRLTFKLDDDERIIDAKFKTFGCASAIASASALTEMIIGKTLEEVLKITNQDIADHLGGLPKEKMHCSVMGWEALEAAIAYYRGEKTGGRDEQEDHGRLVCSCFGVTENLIRKVIKENDLKSIEEVTYYCKAGGGCGSCHEEIEEIIKEERDEPKPAGAPPEPVEIKSAMTNIEKIAKIQETINSEIKPSLAKDGGDIELIDVEGNKVKVALRGACSSCPSAGVTLRFSVERKLKEFVSEDLEVEEVK